jgi:hypothetical protein
MSTHLQNLQIMQQLKTPLAKKLAPAAFDLGEFFQKDMADVNWKYSPEARPAEAAKLRRKAIRDLHDNIRKPIDKRRAATEAMRAKATMPAFDKTDKDAAKARHEAREASRTMSSGERRALMSGPNRDPDFIDAVRERKPWYSGIREPDELQILEIAIQERSRELNAPLLDAVAARDSEDEEVLMVYNKVRNDIAAIAADSGLDRDAFEAEAKPIEAGGDKPWVTSDRRQVIEIQLDGWAFYRPGASNEEGEHGRVYSPQAYQADRSAA